MGILKKQNTCKLIFSCLILTFLSFSTVSNADATIPDGLKIEAQFKPGYGAVVGTMQLVQGRVVITHQGIPSGFLAKQETPLFQGDTIYTDTKGRARFKLNDGSIMTLSYSTKLTINKSVYNPEKQQQSSFLNLSIGKARFWVVKLLAYQNASFNVKTSTFVAGVRGSDFIIIATPEHAELTALADTNVDITSLSAPDAPPVKVTSFQRTIVKHGGLPHSPVNVPMKQINMLMKEFRLEEKETGAGTNRHIEKQKKEESNTTQPFSEMQIPPEALGKIESFQNPDLSSPLKKAIPTYMEKKDIYTQSRIYSILKDAELLLPPLPDMPKTPE